MKRILAVFLIFILIISGCKERSADSEAIEPTVVFEPAPIEETISIVAVGDNLLHMPVINSGKKADGSYDFSHIFEKLQPRFQNADLAVIGQETVFGGEHLGYSGYPLFNSPTDMGDALVKEGFDIVLHASNHIMDKGTVGIENTQKFWKSYPAVTVLGINESVEEKEKVDIIEVKGARLALLNYTYSTNGIPVPEDKGYLVNYIDEEKIAKDAAFAEENADFTIAFMHWGTEYSVKPDEWQRSLCEMMCSLGVDLIIGAHPHVIEPVEWYTAENGNRMLVYYSLGNYVSRQLELRNLLGGLADIQLCYDGKTVSVKEYRFVPIVTHYNREYRGFGVYALKDYTNDLAALHGIVSHDGAASVERFRGIVESVFEGYDKTCLDY